MRGLVAVGILALALAACGGGSTLGAELDQGLAEMNGAIARGETEVACARLAKVRPAFGQWADHTSGDRGTRAKAIVARLDELDRACAPPPKGDPARVTAAWPGIYGDIRQVSGVETSWLTLFTYVSMIAVGAGTYWFLRRRGRTDA